MNTIFKHKILAGVALLAALFAGTSCEDKIGPEVTPEAPYADKTLYEVIMADKDLTDFVEVLKACNLPGATFDVADSLFNTSRVYTLWAPVNGAFDKDAVIKRIKDGYRDDVMKTFVESHVANHLHAAKGIFEKNNFVVMVNDKMVVFEGSYKTGYKFGGCNLVQDNIKVLNGMLHKLEKASQYKYNIWEYLKMDKAALDGHEIDSFANFLYSYDDTKFDEYQSISGPIVDGVQTYLDSVFVTTNKLLNVYNGVGYIEAEDSLYDIYVPTNAVWNSFMKQAEKHFNYSTKNLPASIKADIRYIDSLKHFYPRYNMVKYLTFSEYEQMYADDDSLLPANRDKWERPVFKPGLFEKSTIVHNKELSNGTFNIINKFPYSIFDLWHDTIKIEGENTEMRISTNGVEEHRFFTVTRGEMRPVYRDYDKKGGSRLSGDRYYEAYTQGSTAQVSYRLPNVKSASYKIAIILVPKDITVESQEPNKPACLNLTISQNGEQQPVYSATMISNDPNRVDTLFFPVSYIDKTPKSITFPYCEYYNTQKNADFTTTLDITSWGLGANDKTLRIDAILLIPVEDAE